MDQHTLSKLEYDKIIERLMGKCHSPLGRQKCAGLQPSTDYESIKKALAESHQMTEILQFEEPFPMQTVDDVDSFFSRLKIASTYIDATEYIKIAHFLRTVAGIKRYMKPKAEKYPLICAYANDLMPCPEIIEKVEKAIDKSGEIKDSASSRLRSIRTEKQVVRNKILTKLEAMIQDHPAGGSRQDNVITIRDNRYVVPMATSDVTSRTGVIHGRSKSGATLFVEPMATVEANNHLRELMHAEEAEIERILIDIGDSVRDNLDNLHENYRLISIIDFIHAKGRLAVQLDSHLPKLNDGPVFNLKKAFHPLLLMASENKSEVVPSDISLGDDFDCLIITGPNMGGKTVALKTAGLLSLMSQAGLLIPADKDSEVGIFDHVFADIGDEQSIELSLSTFSSHISKIIEAVKNCGDRSLILMDELGAGTDPLEGSALGESILLDILRKNGKAIITTHYSALKTLAEKDKRFKNASLEFNHKTLQPTYRLMIGLPGSSYAIEMAKRLGMPSEIIDDSVKLVGSQEMDMADLIQRLQSQTREAEERAAEAEENMKEVDRLREHYIRRIDQMDEEQRDFKQKALEDAQKLVDNTRTELERLVRNIKESKADKKSVKEAHEYIRTKSSDIKTYRERIDKPAKPEKEPEKLQPGDTVFIENLQTKGELLDYDEKKDNWRVQTGSMIVNVGSDLLRKTSSGKKESRIPSGVNYAPFEDVSTQISLRGMTSEEAEDALDKYLDSVSLANLETVYILHGKGTGALRKTVDQFLRRHPLVKSHRLGYFNEGGAGVTVVTLKRN